MIATVATPTGEDDLATLGNFSERHHHQGVAAAEGDLLAAGSRQRLEQGVGLSAAGHQPVLTALRVLDRLDAELVWLCQIAAFARRQPGCRALQTRYGVGPIIAVAIWAQLGDTRRFSASRKTVRHTGLDITVHSSDAKRAADRLSRQGSPLPRWALLSSRQMRCSPGLAPI